MKYKLVLPLCLLALLLIASPVYAQTADINKIQTFIKNIINVMVTLSGLVSSGFFVWGGFGYMKSTGDPEALDRSKRTIIYSAIGLIIVLGAFVLSNTVSQFAAETFGAGK